MAMDDKDADDLGSLLVGVRKRPPRAEAESYFLSFTDSLREDTQAFVAHLREAGVLTGPAYTPDSLAAVEAHLLSHLHRPADLEDPTVRAVFLGTYRYLGETILRNAGGDWEWEELWERGEEGAGMPFIRADSPAGYATGGTVDVYTTVLGAAGTRSGTYFRELLDAILRSFGEPGPIDLSSGWRGMALAAPERINPTLAAWLVDNDRAIDTWTTDRVSYGSLDLSQESLDAVEQWLLDSFPTADALEDRVLDEDVRGASRYVATTFVRHGGGRIDLPHAPFLKNVRRVKDEDSHPSVSHVWERGCAGAYVPVWDLLMNAVDDFQIGSRTPRSGGVLRAALEKYRSEEPDVD
ncbi:hypothetical protein [Brevibacterium litoralis]|uniref:hypothetical protein n=1 Tax=Brevibacterium litoralis TaxID=3138935 RepID=UPI0032EAF7BA